jgi:hypothetical protein
LSTLSGTENFLIFFNVYKAKVELLTTDSMKCFQDFSALGIMQLQGTLA